MDAKEPNESNEENTFVSDDIKVEVSELYVIVTIPLIEPKLSASGKSHIIAQTLNWVKTGIRDSDNGARQIMVPPITIISK